jgi:hypothetical protein
VGGGPAMAKDVKAAFDDSLAQDGDARADRKTKMNWCPQAFYLTHLR